MDEWHPRVRSAGGVYRAKSLVYDTRGWFVERVHDADFFGIGLPALFRLSHLVGCHVGLFPSGPESEMSGRHSLYRSCMVGRKLYCGNLSFNMSSSDLEQLFSQFGTVQSAQVVADRDTGRSRGFGFVEMGSDAEAQAAISGLNEKEYDGRALTVNEARPREERRGGGGPQGGFGGGRRGGSGGGGRGGRY